MLATVSDLRFQLSQPVFQNPFTTYRISEEVDEWLRGNFLIGSFVKTGMIRSALNSIIGPFLKSLDLSDVITLVTEFQARGAALPSFQPETLHRDNPTYSEIQTAVENIWNHTSEIRLLQDEVHHYSDILGEATDVYGSLIEIVTAYLLNEDDHVTVFKNLAERKRFVENITADLLVYKNRLHQLKISVQGFEESVLRPRLNLLLRNESSIRLFCKVDQAERDVNWGLSRRKTTSPYENDVLDDALDHVGPTSF